MYNGNGNGSRFGGFNGRGIPPLYLYIGIGVLVLLGIWLVTSLLKPGIDGYFALVAGVLLVLGNLRDLIFNGYPQKGNIALLNTLIGSSLVFFWLGKGGFPPIGAVWYVPAVLALLAAAPLMLGRAGVYAAYVNTARNLVDGARQVVGSILPRTRV